MSHSKTQFQSKWFSIVDENVHFLNSYIVQQSKYEGKCTLCQKVIDVSHNGLYGILQHAKGKKHKDKLITLNVRPKNKEDDDKSTKQPTLTALISSDQKVEASTKSTPPKDWLNAKSQAAKSEIKYCLKFAKYNIPLSTADCSKDEMVALCPDSVVAKHFSMSRQKMSYLFGYGLGPYFRQKTVSEVLESGAYFTVHFDETVTGQAKKQMDILLRFWASSSLVQVRYLHSLFFGHAFAKNVVDGLLDLLESLHLPLNKFLSISADGPNVNKSIKEKLNVAVRKAGSPGLIDVGFCYNHVVHNAVKKGNQKFGQKSLDFAIAIYTWFHMYPARSEDFQLIQEEESLEKLKFLRHVDSRWLTLLPALRRIREQFPAIKKYFLDFIPKNEKVTTKTKRYISICEEIKKNEKSLLVEMTFLEGTKPLFDEFLCAFQAEGPLVHMLYTTLVDMLRKLMRRFIRPELLMEKNGDALAKIDVSNRNNQLSDTEIELGIPCRNLIEPLPSLLKKECMEGIRNFYSSSVSYLQEKLPYKNVLLQSLFCLQPNCKTDPTTRGHIRTIATAMPCTSDEDVVKVLDEWRVYQEVEVPQEWKKLKRVDEYWGKILSMVNPMGNKRFPVLSVLVRSALSLAHGNADSERSLSENRKIATSERALLSEKTLVGIRLSKDAVKSNDNNPFTYPISKEMLAFCSGAHAMYQKEKEEAAKKKRQETTQKHHDQEEQDKAVKKEDKGSGL